MARILRQTWALVQKNFRIFAKSPISTVVRALLFPILVSTLLSLARRLWDTNRVSSSGIVDSARPIRSLADAINGAATPKLVFVPTTIPPSYLDPVINGIMGQPGMEGVSHVIFDDPSGLFSACRQTLRGQSDCFAAVIFTAFNDTGVEYTIAVDSSVGNAWPDYRKHSSVAIDRLFPLQWAIDAQIGNFTSAPMPAELPWDGYLTNASVLTELTESLIQEQSNPWFFLISNFLAPIFILSLMGIVYHLSLSVATERQSGVSELLAAHTCTTTPRILSTMISFTILYLPGWIIGSILITRILFTSCSDILFLFMTLLAGLAIAASSHLVASFFRKAQLSGLYTSTIMFALAFVTVAFTLNSRPSLVIIEVLSAFFPPIAYVTLISDIARAETRFYRYSLSPSDLPSPNNSHEVLYPQFAGYLYIVFFILQIVVYTAATFAVERYLWGVKREFKVIDTTSDVALRCTKLSKTYNARHRWYWPFTYSSPLLAVDSLDLELKKGSVNFLLGPNGGGKTTTLKCIAGMTAMDPTSLLEVNEDGLDFGVCPQGNVFWPTLSVIENIKIWRKVKAAAPDRRDEDDTLVECDLLGKKNSAARTLSGGQMRKLQLAIAFVGGSKMCYVDEATSGLDPLSRRNIWNIIAKGHARRTVLMTTHFLDEADILADHIAIIFKGKLVCAGSGTNLKANYGDSYEICESEPSNEAEKAMTWKTTTSADATKQVLELEKLTNRSYSITFPTLEQVFLRVTKSESSGQKRGGDGVVGEESAPDEVEEPLPGDIIHSINDFESGRAISIFRQIAIILRKRYTLLRYNWLSFGIALATPIIIAGALSSVLRYLPSFTPCEMKFAKMVNSTPFFEPQALYYNQNFASAVVGPPEVFQGPSQDELYAYSTENLFRGSSYGGAFNASSDPAFDKRVFASSLNETVSAIVNHFGNVGFGLFAPSLYSATILHQISTYVTPEPALAAMSVVTNRIANATATSGTARKVEASFRNLRNVTGGADFRILPLTLLVLLGLITSTAAAVIYPTFERVNNVRALQYCNGVSPIALWIAYLIFDMQVTIVTALITWGLLFYGVGARIWFAPNYLLGVMILFGFATYQGVYVLSTFVRRAAFAVAAGLHVVLFGIYLAAYVFNQYSGVPEKRAHIYDQLQSSLGLTSPAANLARAFFITTNNYDLACGDTGYAVQDPGSYNLYGGVYFNLILQILFLSGCLVSIEYGSMEWYHKIVSRKAAHAPKECINLEEGATGTNINMKNLNPTTSEYVRDARDSLLDVSEVSKHFGKITAVENVSFNISSDETLALLGANGAGKTTIINMIRGLIKPNHGNIHLDGVSIIDQPQKARVHMGVCPQDDAIDELTVRQTLNFFASIKGVKNIQANVDKMMSAFDITQFESFSVKKLSGGTRRKLMVAIALIGNPRVLLLDEPSTGLDAGAKRVLWKILQSLGGGRAVLLTTHSMEETEALASNVAIIGTRLLASGTLAQLRNSYGGFYSIRASYGPEISDSEAERLIVDQFQDNVSSIVVRYGEANFQLPHEPRKLGMILRTMEGLMQPKAVVEMEVEEEMEDERVRSSEARVFMDYTITEPTMDMVFMNVCVKAGGVQL